LALMESLLGEQELTAEICGVSTQVSSAAPIVSVKVLFLIKHLDSCQSREESYETLVDLGEAVPAESIVAEGVAACRRLFLESKLGIIRSIHQESSMQPYHPGPLQAGYAS